MLVSFVVVNIDKHNLINHNLFKGEIQVNCSVYFHLFCLTFPSQTINVCVGGVGDCRDSIEVECGFVTVVSELPESSHQRSK